MVVTFVASHRMIWICLFSEQKGECLPKQFSHTLVFSTWYENQKTKTKKHKTLFLFWFWILCSQQERIQSFSEQDWNTQTQNKVKGCRKQVETQTVFETLCVLQNSIHLCHSQFKWMRKFSICPLKQNKAGSPNNTPNKHRMWYLSQTLHCPVRLKRSAI